MMTAEEHLNKRMNDCIDNIVENLELLVKELDTVVFAYEQDKKFSLKRYSYLLNKRIPEYSKTIQRSLNIYDRTEKRLIEETI